MSPFILTNGLVLRSNDPCVVDLQATRCSLHISKFQGELLGLARSLSAVAGCSIMSKDTLGGEDPLLLSKTAYLLFDYTDFEIRSVTTKPIRATWAPIMIFICGRQVSSLRVTYDKNGARISGATTLIDDDMVSAKCRTVKTAKKLLTSHLSSMILKK